MEGTGSSVHRIMILTSHGIRTNARWQKILESIVLAEVEKRNKNNVAPGVPKLEVAFRHNDYRYFSIFSFLNPFRRRSETAKFEARLRDYIESGTFDEIHLVGHSFGTHIVGRSLQAIGGSLNGKVGTVILAASVLPGAFAWDGLFKNGIRRLVNECGDNDLVLVFNAMLPFGSGLAGRRGFAGITGDHFRNRFFRFGHSGYFRKRPPDGVDDTWFMQKYWVPLLLGDTRTPFIDEREDGYYRLFLGWLVDQSENLKWLVPVGFLGVLALVFLYLALVWRTNFNLETLDVAAQVTDAVERGELHGIAEKIANRQAAIEAAANGPLTTVEGIIRGDARASFNPGQWERARTAAKFAIRQKKVLTTEEVDEVQFYGSDVARTRSLGDRTETEEEQAETRTRITTFDLRTGKPSESAMWQWTGPYAGSGTLVPKGEYGLPRLQPAGLFGLQGQLENELAISLSPAGLTLWDITSAKPRASWQPEGWGATPLITAKPCGRSGDALVLTREGKAFVLHLDGTANELATPDPLVHVIADRSCTRFAAATNKLALVAWTEKGRILHLLADRNVQSFEFSASRDLLLVNSTPKGNNETTRADLIAFSDSGAAPVERFERKNIEIAAFSPRGVRVATKDGEACSIYETDALVSNAENSASSLNFTCPKDAGDAMSLSGHIRVFDNEKLALITRADRGSFGDSHLEVLDLSKQRSQWLVPGSRYDIVSLAASSDGGVIATTAGDSADEGYGADRSFYVWSTYSFKPIYQDTRGPNSGWEARRAWLTQDGTRAVVAWRRSDPETNDFAFETEVVDIDPDISAAFGTAGRNSAAPKVWGISPDDLDVPPRRCEGVSETAEWADESSEEAIRWISSGCLANTGFLLRATVDGIPAQFRVFRDNDGWKIRIRKAGTTTAEQVRYPDGTLMADDIRDFVSDPAEHRIFVLHEKGDVTRLDLAGNLAANRIREATSENDDTQLDWDNTHRWLRTESSDTQSDSGTIRKLRFYDAGGRLARQYDDLTKWNIAKSADGVFDHNGQYWTSADQTINSQNTASTIVDGVEDTETKAQRVLVNLDTGETFRPDCDGKFGQRPAQQFDAPPSLRISRSGRYLGAGDLAPTIGAAQNNTEMQLFDLAERKCLGTFRHGGEIYDFAISNDGRLLATQGLNELNLWHVPTQTVIRTFFGPTRLIDDDLGLRVITRADSDNPAAWPIPGDLEKWL